MTERRSVAFLCGGLFRQLTEHLHDHIQRLTIFKQCHKKSPTPVCNQQWKHSRSNARKHNAAVAISILAKRRLHAGTCGATMKPNLLSFGRRNRVYKIELLPSWVSVGFYCCMLFDDIFPWHCHVLLEWKYMLYSLILWNLGTHSVPPLQSSHSETWSSSLRRPKSTKEPGFRVRDYEVELFGYNSKTWVLKSQV